MAILTCEQAVRDLLGPDFIEFLVGRIDEAALECRAYFKQQKKKYDGTLGASMMRYHLRQKLMEAQGVRFTEYGHGFLLLSPYNLGIWFEFEGLTCRVYRVRDGKTPMPGGSERRQKFMANAEPDKRPLSNKDWRGNVMFLVSLDGSGLVERIRVVMPDGFDESGELQMTIDFDLPTTAVELQRTGFQVEEEVEESLIKVDTSTEVKRK